MHEAIDCYREITPGCTERLARNQMKELNQWPHDPPYFKVLMEEYISFCRDLSRKIMRGIALALGGSADEFEGERAGDAFWVLRVIGYPGVSNTNGQNAPENDIGCGAHTDYGLVTLVNQDDGITALQLMLYLFTVLNVASVVTAAHTTFLIKEKKKEELIFLLAKAKSRSIDISEKTCLASGYLPLQFREHLYATLEICFKIWSNGMYDSTLHRVINNSPKYRVCVAYFYEVSPTYPFYALSSLAPGNDPHTVPSLHEQPNFDAAVEPLDICKEKTGGIKKFGKSRLWRAFSKQT
ncbi:hypothetical protein NC653_018745 [Populus alba x Populus x berolinensis]|uniref:Fe2OG dioxygenase domain-containing protein n=1 Tax=Populus alba x Populus x berolinensis TaxID=444605 RepID=A0AAD6VWG4_9ROSI|nr:hypothetical protein NC653_018745 [Populus alba x Populus x berolinensis]